MFFTRSCKGQVETSDALGCSSLQLALSRRALGDEEVSQWQSTCPMCEVLSSMHIIRTSKTQTFLMDQADTNNIKCPNTSEWPGCG